VVPVVALEVCDHRTAVAQHRIAAWWCAATLRGRSTRTTSARGHRGSSPHAGPGRCRPTRRHAIPEVVPTRRSTHFRYTVPRDSRPTTPLPRVRRPLDAPIRLISIVYPWRRGGVNNSLPHFIPVPGWENVWCATNECHAAAGRGYRATPPERLLPRTAGRASWTGSPQ
jgi:hypothetical protein